jgi:hypothetical protein
MKLIKTKFLYPDGLAFKSLHRCKQQTKCYTQFIKQKHNDEALFRTQDCELCTQRTIDRKKQ